jgi:dephospho-CoA kinase
MSHKQLVIAICGGKGCGKDTIAHLIEKHYDNFVSLKFASKLKEITQYIFQFTNNQIEHHTEKETIDKRWGITPRQAMQFIGTEMFQFKIQELCPVLERNVWVNALIHEIKQKYYSKKIVISDFRFLHEYHALKNDPRFHCVCIRIDRNTKQHDNHSSEQEFEQIPCDYIIDNNGGITHLQKQVFNIMQQL